MKWRCFHCNDVFTNRRDAAEHFGASEQAEPACKLAHSLSHLVAYVRKLERDIRSYQAEDSHVMRSMCSMQSEHAKAVRDAEERGYNRGVQDMKSKSDRLVK